MADQPPQRPIPAQPHKLGWFFNLLGLYDRQSRPITTFFDDVDGDDFSFANNKTEQIQRLFTLAADRNRRYEIYDEMDTTGLVSAILDVYAEESTQRDYDKGVSVWIESKASHMVEAGNHCLHNCQVEDRIAAIVRRFCKYGDGFQRLLYATEKGVLGWRMANTAKVQRIEDKYGRLVGFQEEGKKYRVGKRETSWPWDYVHFRLLGKDEESGYGTSLLAGMFKDWRRMTLTEEAILMYRLRRMPDRNLIQVNVGNMAEVEAMSYLNQWRKKFRKYEIVDPSSPAYKKQYNPITPIEDVFMPLIDGRENRIDTISGAGNVGEVFDLDHFRDAFFGSAKVPKAYFGFEGDINAKATLIQQDVRFARTCKRIQRVALYGLRQLLDIHYTLLQKPGKTDDAGKYDFRDKKNAYLVQMSPISYLDEFERLELVQLRFQIVSAMENLAQTMQLDPRVWATYVLLNYAKLPEDMVLKLIAKVPDKPTAPVVGGGPGFESLSKEKQAQILDWKREARAGFYPLNEAEQIAIARCVHDSPGLRKSISTWAEYGEEVTAFDRMMAAQTDPSLVPPIVGNGKQLSDVYEEGKEAKELKEDLDALAVAKK